MIETDIPGFPGLVRGVSTREHGSMPRTTSTSEVKLANRNGLVFHLGFDPARICQARPRHETLVSFVEDSSESVLEADALMTDVPNRLLTVATADCHSVFLCTPSRKAVAIIHAGWRGVVRGIVPVAVEFFRWRYGVKQREIGALIGPGIQKCCFEVKNDENALTNFVSWPGFISGGNGRHFVDLAGIVSEQLHRAGVRAVSKSGECTCCSPLGFFSFRRDKNSLRGISFVGFMES